MLESPQAVLARLVSAQPELDEHWPMARAMLTVELAVGRTFAEAAESAHRLALAADGAERVVWALVADFCGGMAAP